jgi:ribosome biogenesis GTPase
LSKLKVQTPNPSFKQALVTTNHGRHSLALDENGATWQVYGKGKRREVAVGDQILIQPSGDNQAWVEKILPRHNIVYRSDAMRSKLFAANLDLVVLVLAAVPPYSPELLGRTLIACATANVPLQLVFNKMDLLHNSPEFVEDIQTTLSEWTLNEIPIHYVSLTTEPEQAQEQLKVLFKNKTTLVLGQSGMGKSTLINLLIPHALAPTNDVSIALNAGKHTTTHTQMHFGDEGIRLIDSPGFQAFGLHHLTAQDLLNGFSDIKEAAQQCRFANCLHNQEPQCAVKDAIETEKLFEPRLDLYRLLTDELEQAKHRY